MKKSEYEKHACEFKNESEAEEELEEEGETLDEVEDKFYKED